MFPWEPVLTLLENSRRSVRRKILRIEGNILGERKQIKETTEQR
jgi:hypothetical protein